MLRPMRLSDIVARCTSSLQKMIQEAKARFGNPEQFCDWDGLALVLLEVSNLVD